MAECPLRPRPQTKPRVVAQQPPKPSPPHTVSQDQAPLPLTFPSPSFLHPERLNPQAFPRPRMMLDKGPQAAGLAGTFFPLQCGPHKSWGLPALTLSCDSMHMASALATSLLAAVPRELSIHSGFLNVKRNWFSSAWCILLWRKYRLVI